MFRLSLFIVAVSVLVGLVFSGGFLSAEQASAGRADLSAQTPEVTEALLHSKADLELAQIEAKAQGQPEQGAAGQDTLPVVPLTQWLSKKMALSDQDPELAAIRTGKDAEKAALAVGQDPSQAQEARITVETIVRQRLAAAAKENKR